MLTVGRTKRVVVSEYYQHFLIPVSPDFRPGGDAVSQFVRDLAERGHVPDNYSLSYSAVTKGEFPAREMTNPFTGETMSLPSPSRQLGKPQSLASVDSLRELTGTSDEYDVSISADGLPTHPPLKIGYVNESSWKPVEDPYHLEIRCRVRSHIVRLYMLRSEDDLHRPPDFANPPAPMFDEDCGADESEGLFVHPEAGAIRISNAGCGMFWIEFNFGTFIFPRLRNGGVDLLDDAIKNQAVTTFGTDFVQACSWG